VNFDIPFVKIDLRTRKHMCPVATYKKEILNLIIDTIVRTRLTMLRLLSIHHP